MQNSKEIIIINNPNQGIIISKPARYEKLWKATGKRRKLDDEEAKREGTGEDMNDISGRERLKRLWVKMAGQVWIPDVWGQEGLLKDWIDCTAFDVSSSQIMSARASLAEEGRRKRRATPLVAMRIGNCC